MKEEIDYSVSTTDIELSTFVNIKFCSASLCTITLKMMTVLQKHVNICSVHRLKVCANEPSHVAPFKEISD